MIKKGDKVKIDYTGKLDDGTVFDSSTHGDHSHPLEFEVGSGKVIPGFDNAVMGMKLDEEKDIVIEPKDAYGQPNKDLVKPIPKSQIPESDKIQKGMQLMMQTNTGQQLPVIVVDVDETNIMIDLNHPLAGKTLHFHIKVVEIN
jgi:peptidylprolyl isomerase